jgi:hypothetical protein
LKNILVPNRPLKKSIKRPNIVILSVAKNLAFERLEILHFVQDDGKNIFSANY